MPETSDELARRWFLYGMNDKERIEHLMAENERLRKENAELRQKIDKERTNR